MRKKQKTVEDIAKELRKNWQKMADRDGLTISISSNCFNNGEEVIIAKPKDTKKEPGDPT